jgi:hypothetical protein
MDEPKPTPTTTSSSANAESAATPTVGLAEPVVARGSGVITSVPERIERTEHSVMEGLPKDKAERVAAMRRELAELQKQLTDAQQRIATELQGRADDAERIEALETEIAELRAKVASTDVDQSMRAQLETELEQERTARARTDAELEQERTAHRDVKEQLAMQDTALRDANALVVTRNNELAEITAKRDALANEIDGVKRELEAARTKLRDVANQIAVLGRSLVEPGTVTTEPSQAEAKPVEAKPVEANVEVADAKPEPNPPGSRPAIPLPAIKRVAPPPVPARVASDIDAAPIFEVTEEAKSTSVWRSGLLLVTGVAAGCALSFALMRNNASNQGATIENEDTAGAAAASAPPMATAPAPVMRVEETVQPAPPVETPQAAPVEPTPAPANAVAEVPIVAPPAEASTEGVIVLPPSAEGHRVYVDGKIVQVKGSRAKVSCGSHEIKIGSSGTAQKLDVSCGGETVLAEAPRDR